MAIPGDKERFHDAAYEMSLRGPEVTLRGTYDRDVLEDAVEGSTMPYKLSDMIESGTPAEQREARSLKRHIPKIEAKLAEIGINAHFPKG